MSVERKGNYDLWEMNKSFNRIIISEGPSKWSPEKIATASLDTQALETNQVSLQEDAQTELPQ